MDEIASKESSLNQVLEEQRPRIIVAIPAYNEEVAIGSVVLKAKKYTDDVIVVDDGSTDSTAEVAGLAGAYVIRHARNLGKGMAIRTAWLQARKMGPDAFVLIDGDHQHKPEDIPRLAGPILAGEADVMIGVRGGKTSGMPTYRRIGKRILDHATAWGFKRGLLTDSQSGYRAFSMRALTSLEPEESGLGIESQMLVEAQEMGLKIREVNIEARYDVKGSTFSPGRHGFGVLSRIISLISEKRPLFFFGMGGATLLLTATILAFIVANTFYTTGELAVGYSFIVVLLAIVGILSIFIGIVLHAMRKLIRA